MNRYSMQRAKMKYKFRRQQMRSGGGGVLFLMLLVVLVLVYAFLTLPPSGDEVRKSEVDKTFSPRQLQKDFTFLMNTLEDVHPDLYAVASREEIDAERQRIEAQLDHPMTRLEFYRLVGPLLSRFGDGHTRAGMPKAERLDYVEQGALLFPLDVRFDEDAVRVKYNYTNDSLVAEGTQILGINGISIEQIENRMLQYISGERISWRRKMAAQSFRWQLWMIYGIESPYEVTVLRTTPRGSTPISRTFLGLTNEELEAKRPVETEPEDDGTVNFSYTTIQDRYVPNVGLIDFNSFSDLAGFKVFLDTTFRNIREQGVEDLIIDLRGNGGGNSELGDELINYLYDQPYQQVSQMDVKVSKQVKRYCATWVPWYFRWYPPLAGDFYKKIWSTPEGEIASFESELTQPVENAFRFEGPVFVLIDTGTFSSGTLFAATIKDYGIGTLVGEETGGLATHFGEIYSFHLPESKLAFSSSCKRFLRPSGEDTGRGVIPDVVPNPADFRRLPEDLDIATTLNLIREDRRTRTAETN